MHLPTIDHTVQLTREWVRDLADRLDWPDEHRAWRLLRVTLQALRDWLDVNEAAHLGAQLPILVRGLYYEGWHPAKTPAADHSMEAFLARIEDAFSTDPLDDAEEAVGAVFRLLNSRISRGEIADVRQRLPKHLRALWPE
jgi:uncharacterized protein (DUF2267 family)